MEGGDGGSREPTLSERDRHCPWCSATVSREATQCSACGAALAQRESLAGLKIAGVTAVDPALEAYAAQPRRIPGNSPSQSMAINAIGAAAALPGPVALAAIGGLAGVAALEYIGARRGEGGGPVELELVGRPSELALEVAERLDRGDHLPASSDDGPERA